MPSAANLSRSPLQETTKTNKENESRIDEESYKKLQSNDNNADQLENQTVQKLAMFLKLEEDKFPNLKRLNSMLLEKLKEANSKLQSLELEKEEWQQAVEQLNFQKQELSDKLREAEEREKFAKEEAEQLQLQIEIQLKEIEKAREDFDKISNLFEEQLEENSTLQEEKSDILKQVRLLKDAKKQLEMSMEQLNEQLNSLSNDNEKLKQKIQQYQLAFEVRDEALQQISAELREKRQKVNQLQVECVEKADKILKLERTRQDVENEKAKLEQAMKEKQQFFCEFHTLVSELEVSNSQNIQKKDRILASSREPSIETMSVESYSETNETAEWQDLGKLKKIIELRNEVFSDTRQRMVELETKVKRLTDTIESQKEDSKKTVMMSRLLSAIRRLFSFWLLPVKKQPKSLSLQYENTTENNEYSSSSTHS